MVVLSLSARGVSGRTRARRGPTRVAAAAARASRAAPSLDPASSLARRRSRSAGPRLALSLTSVLRRTHGGRSSSPPTVCARPR